MRPDEPHTHNSKAEWHPSILNFKIEGCLTINSEDSSAGKRQSNDMSLFDDLAKFLETRLDEFLKANPHLELRALEDQLRGQEEDSIRLVGDLKRREKQVEDSILETAKDIQQWHSRVGKSESC